MSLSTAVSLLPRPRASSPSVTCTVGSGSTPRERLAMIKTRRLSIRPALQPFEVEAAQGWLSSVQICAVEISGADVDVACQSRLASSPCIQWKTNSVSC